LIDYSYGVTDNGVSYVELNNISSFSGGTAVYYAETLTRPLLENQLIDIENVDTTKIYPNPFQNELTVSLSDEAVYTISVYNTMGKRIETHSNVSHQLTFGANLSTGVYIVHITESSGTTERYKVEKVK